MRPRSVKRISIVLTSVVAVGLVLSFNEKDGMGRDHVFSPVQRAMRSLIGKATHVDEEEAARIRAAIQKKQSS